MSNQLTKFNKTIERLLHEKGIVFRDAFLDAEHLVNLVDIKGKYILVNHKKEYFFKQERKELATVINNIRRDIKNANKTFQKYEYLSSTVEKYELHEKRIFEIKDEIDSILIKDKYKKLGRGVYNWVESIMLKILAEQLSPQ